MGVATAMDGGGSRDVLTRVHTCFSVGEFLRCFLSRIIRYPGAQRFYLTQQCEAGSSGRRDDSIYRWTDERMNEWASGSACLGRWLGITFVCVLFQFRF